MRENARPKLKSVFPMFEVEGSLYFQGSGQLIEVGEPSEELRHLLLLLDGNRELSAIHQDLMEKFPAARIADIDGIIAELDASGLLEDASHPVLLSDYARQRWSRNLGFLETYSSLDTSKFELQRRIADSRVAVLGVGGIGSHVLFELAAIGVGEVRLVDFDAIELSNLNRQILYREADIGKRKAETAKQRILEFNSSMRVETVDKRISCAEDVQEVVSGFDVVIAAVDRPKMHIVKWLNEGCVAAGVPLITGGLDTQRALYFTIIPGHSGCVACWERSAASADPVAAEISAQMLDIEAAQVQGERFGQDFAAFSPLVSVQTASVVSEFVRLVTRIAPPTAAGRLIEIRFADLVAREAESWERLPDCPICGRASRPAPAPVVES